MRKLLTATLAVLIAAGVAHAQKIKGSDTVLPVTGDAAECYMKLHPGETVTVTGGGSGVGISSLLDGTTDIAMASRAIKFGEKMELKKARKELCETVVAYDALAVVVNPRNPVSNLTREQLEAIFRGKITNWKDIVDPVTHRRGADKKIIVYSRETSSGTYEFFKTSVLREKNYMAGVLSMPATGAIIQSVSQTEGAIGYVGMAYINPHVKALSVSYDNRHFVYPDMQAGRQHRYPIVRALYYYYTQDRAAAVKPFIDYLLSDAGQRIVMKTGYVPVR